LDGVPGAPDQEFVAVGAVGVGGVGVDVAFIDVAEASFAGDLAGAMKSFGRRGRLVLEFEIGMKCGEVQRNIRAQIGENPVGEFASFGGIIVERGDHEIGDLKPDVGFLLEPFQSFEHGREMRQRDFSVEMFGQGFEVNVGGVDMVVDVVEGFAGDVAVGDHDGFEAVGLGGLADVDDVFAPDGGFVVGEGDGSAAVFFGEQRNVFGRDVFGVDLILVGFGDVPILAEETAHIAAGGAHAEDAGAGEKMIEGLFFDGVDLQGGGSGVAEAVEFAVFVGADIAETGLALADVTVARAKVTVDAVVRFGFPPQSFVKGGGGLEDLERGHRGAALERLYAWVDWAGEDCRQVEGKAVKEFWTD